MLNTSNLKVDILKFQKIISMVKSSPPPFKRGGTKILKISKRGPKKILGWGNKREGEKDFQKGKGDQICHVEFKDRKG